MLALAGLVLLVTPVQAQDGDPMGGLVIRALPLDGAAALPAVEQPVVTASLQPQPDMTLLTGLDGPRPLGPGFPVPSVVVGDLAVLLTAGPRGPFGLSHDAREAIRARDAEMFFRILAQGGFDPEDGQVVAAIQSELARMACYGGAIDGDWGAGSVAALGRYVQAGGPAQAGAQADVALFRAMVDASGLVCAAPVAAPVAAAPVTPARPAAAQPQPAAPRAAAPAPAAAPVPAAPSAPRQITPGLLGSGVFR